MNWEDRPAKEKARKWLLEKIRKAYPDTTQRLSYTGLPAGACVFEKKLLSVYPKLNLSLYEANEDEFVKLGGTLCKLRKEYPDICAERFCQVLVAPRPHQICWLDYCGPITEDRLETLRIALRNRPRGGVVGVTFMACREQKSSSELIDLLDRKPFIENLENVPSYFLRRIRALSFFALDIDKGLKIEALPYKDGAPMMLIVFSDGGARSTIEIEPYIKE